MLGRSAPEPHDAPVPQLDLCGDLLGQLFELRPGHVLREVWTLDLPARHGAMLSGRGDSLPWLHGSGRSHLDHHLACPMLVPP